MSRQVVYIESDDDDEESQTKPAEVSSHPMDNEIDQLAVAGLSLADTYSIGCNGRLNKVPDTCYSFWVDASLYVSTFLKIYSYILIKGGPWPIRAH
jgi:hypothetical protein